MTVLLLVLTVACTRSQATGEEEPPQNAAAEERLLPSPAQEAILERIRTRRPDAADQLERLRTINPGLYQKTLEAIQNRARHSQRSRARSRTDSSTGSRPGRRAGRQGEETQPPAGALTGDAPLPSEAVETVRELRAESNALRKEVRTLLTKRQRADSDAERRALTEEIRTTVQTAFDLTTERRSIALEAASERLEAARKRLEAAEAMLQRRKENREDHIRAFMERLEAEGEKALRPRPRRDNRRHPDAAAPAGRDE